MKTLNYITGILLVLLVTISSCKKDDTGSAFINLRMTDAPAAYTAVNIDLKEVELMGDDGAVINMNAKPGIYNLLDLTNGLNVLIATSSYKPGRLEQIRLILGDNNTITVDGVTSRLSTPSAQQSGLKVQVHKDIEQGQVYDFTIDFDAYQSIVAQGNGGYLLKPVLHLVEVAESGSIGGQVAPEGNVVQVVVTGNDLTYSTATTTGGDFIIGGLAEGTYTVVFYPPSPLVTVTLTNIEVNKGATTNLGVVDLSGQ